MGERFPEKKLYNGARRMHGEKFAKIFICITFSLRHARGAAEDTTQHNTHFVYFVLRSIFSCAHLASPIFYPQTQAANKLRSRAHDNSMSAVSDAITCCEDFFTGKTKD
jgi:hypothetical protein